MCQAIAATGAWPVTDGESDLRSDGRGVCESAEKWGHTSGLCNASSRARRTLQLIGTITPTLRHTVLCFDFRQFVADNGPSLLCPMRRNMITGSGEKRFRNGAQDYAAYLETPEGRLRADLAFGNLQDFLPLEINTPMSVLDVGCGTGAAAVRLAPLGFHVTQLDSSAAMLDIARGAADQSGMADRVTLQHGDAAQLATLFPVASFDVILCHNVLEYVDDPAAVLRCATGLLRDNAAILSVLVRNQAGEVLKAAIQAGDLSAAENNLTAEWGFESLYGGKVRLFTPSGVRALLNAEPLELIAERGVRVLADYLPPRVSRSSEYERILALETKLSNRPEYASIARYTQWLVRRVENAA
jgi:S-adenosylmethionine-dependent methyltransferase